MHRTALHTKLIATAAIALATMILFFGVNAADAASSLFGGATQAGGTVTLVSNGGNESAADDYSGVEFDDANGTLFSTLATLAADYDVTDDSCGGGSPRFQIAIDTDANNVSNGNIFVYMGPSPSFTGCVGAASTGNLIGNEEAGRWDYTQLGGPLGGYSGAPAGVLSGTILSINIVVDSSWSAAATGGDSEQTVNIDNVQINGSTYSFTPAPSTVTVTIDKYVDGAQATALSANSASFPMSSTWNDPMGIGSGSGTYALSTSGFNSANPYEAITSEMQQGADYTTSEDTTGSVVGATCEGGQQFRLVGYSSGSTPEEAAAGEQSAVAPAFTGIQSDKYIIVWNATCVTPEEPETVQVFITKFINGQQATAQNASSSVFTMNASWNDTEGIGSGSGTYELTAPTYNTQTINFNDGADYATSEVTGTNVGTSCAAGKPFALSGYKYGESLAAASSSAATTTAPSFTNIQTNKYVIVLNVTCATGVIIGDVVGDQGTLAVTSIDAVDTSATADNSYENGWKYVFHITVPTDESNIAMKFSDWTAGLNTIPAGNNMRISSAQADNGGATITVLAADTYTIPNLHMTTDLNPALAGIQVEVSVEVKVPVGTPNASYSTNYGVKSE